MGDQFDTTDQEIDKLVCELYGLTDDEIAVVEKHQGGANHGFTSIDTDVQDKNH